MDPNAQSTPSVTPESSSGGSRNTLLTLASVLVLAGIVGITLWLYIQNSTSKTSIDSTQHKQSQQVSEVENKISKLNERVYCKDGDGVFIDLTEALKNPEEVCSLSLISAADDKSWAKAATAFENMENLAELRISNKNYFSTEYISNNTKLEYLNLSSNQTLDLKNIGKLTGLKVLNLSNNNLKKISDEITQLADLEGLSLIKTGITKLPQGIEKLKNLKVIDLRENNFSDQEKNFIKKTLPNTEIIF